MLPLGAYELVPNQGADERPVVGLGLSLLEPAVELTESVQRDLEPLRRSRRLSPEVAAPTQRGCGASDDSTSHLLPHQSGQEGPVVGLELLLLDPAVELTEPLQGVLELLQRLVFLHRELRIPACELPLYLRPPMDTPLRRHAAPIADLRPNGKRKKKMERYGLLTRGPNDELRGRAATELCSPGVEAVTLAGTVALGDIILARINPGQKRMDEDASVEQVANTLKLARKNGKKDLRLRSMAKHRVTAPVVGVRALGRFSGRDHHWPYEQLDDTITNVEGSLRRSRGGAGRGVKPSAGEHRYRSKDGDLRKISEECCVPPRS